jgi:hypothetical protein
MSRKSSLLEAMGWVLAVTFVASACSAPQMNPQATAADMHRESMEKTGFLHPGLMTSALTVGTIIRLAGPGVSPGIIGHVRQHGLAPVGEAPSAASDVAFDLRTDEQIRVSLGAFFAKAGVQVDQYDSVVFRATDVKHAILDVGLTPQELMERLTKRIKDEDVAVVSEVLIANRISLTLRHSQGFKAGVDVQPLPVPGLDVTMGFARSKSDSRTITYEYDAPNDRQGLVIGYKIFSLPTMDPNLDSITQGVEVRLGSFQYGRDVVEVKCKAQTADEKELLLVCRSTGWSGKTETGGLLLHDSEVEVYYKLPRFALFASRDVRFWHLKVIHPLSSTDIRKMGSVPLAEGEPFTFGPFKSDTYESMSATLEISDLAYGGRAKAILDVAGRPTEKELRPGDALVAPHGIPASVVFRAHKNERACVDVLGWDMASTSAFDESQRRFNQDYWVYDRRDTVGNHKSEMIAGLSLIAAGVLGVILGPSLGEHFDNSVASIVGGAGGATVSIMGVVLALISNSEMKDDVAPEAPPVPTCGY